MVRNFYVPSEVTDFASPLSRYVDYAKGQNEEDLRNKLDQSAQLEKVHPGVTKLNLLKGILETTKTGVDVYNAFKGPEAKQKKQSDTNRTLFKLITTPESKEAFNTSLQYRASKEGIEAGQKGFIEHVKKNVKDKKLADYLINSSSKELLRATEYAGTQFAREAPVKYQKYINGLMPADRLAYEKRVKGSKENTQLHFNEWALGELDKLGLSEGVSANNVVDELKRISETEGSIALASYKIESLTKENVKFQNSIDTAKLGNTKNPNSLSEVLQDKITLGVDETNGVTVEDSKNHTTALLVMAAHKGDLTDAELASMKNGSIKHPAGNTGEILLNDKQWERIDKAIQSRNNSVVAAHDAKVSGIATNIKSLAAQGQLTTKQKQEGLLRLESLGYDVNSKEYKELENLNINAQTPQFYEAEKLRVDAQLKNGRTSNIDELEIQNNTLKAETEKRLEEFKLFKKDNQYNEGNADDQAGDYVKEALKQTLAKGVSVPRGSPTLVQGHISRKIDQALWQVFNDENLTINDVEAILTNDLTREGLYVKAGDLENENYGILTPNTEGKFPLFEAKYLSKTETKGNFAATEQELNLLWRNKSYENYPGKTSKEKLVNSGLAITLPELVNQAQNPNSWTPDIITKSEVLGIEPSVLVKGKIEALKADKNNKDAEAALKVFDFEKMEIPTSDVEVRKFIENSDDNSNLLAYQQQFGLHNFSPNQLERLVKLEKKFDNFSGNQERVQAIQNKLTKLNKDRGIDATQQQLNDLGIGFDPDKFNLEWDETENKWELRIKE